MTSQFCRCQIFHFLNNTPNPTHKSTKHNFKTKTDKKLQRVMSKVLKKAEVFINFVCLVALINCRNNNLLPYLYQSTFQQTHEQVKLL